MEDVLDVYKRPRDPKRPLVCLDEASKQLLANTREPIPMKKGRLVRTDYEYERNGTANLFMAFAPLEGRRHIKVTDRRTAVDYAHMLKHVADNLFADAEIIVLVQGNLNTHKPASLYEAFPPAEARRLAQRFDWHYTPKHGSWLNMAESELGILSDLAAVVQRPAADIAADARQCLRASRGLEAVREDAAIRLHPHYLSGSKLEAEKVKVDVGEVAAPVHILAVDDLCLLRM
jgi:hypothetical protein